MLRITSTDNPRVKAALKLRDSRDRRATGLFLAEGFREVERALKAGLRVVEWYASAEVLGMELGEMLGRLPLGKGAGDAGGYDVSPAVLKKLAYRDDPEGVIAVFEQPRWELPSPTEGAEGAGGGALYLVGVGIEKPGNLGAMARTAAGAGAGALIAVDAVVDAFNPNAIRASTGAVFSLPVVDVTRGELAAWSAVNKVRLFPAMLIDSARPHTEVDFTGNAAIVIGAEDAGLEAEWTELAAESGGCPVVIPMRTERIDSLNASVAAGILLFEAARQRARR